MPRAGTTALSAYLKNHPNIFISPMKEPCYFDFDFTKKNKLNLEKYLLLFKEADPKIHSAVGEASPTYLHSECAVSEILKFNPDAKFIAILRNPIDLLISLHAQRVFWGEENVVDLEKAWQMEAERKKGKNIPLFSADPKHFIYSEWIKAGFQVERLLSKVDKKNVKLIIFDDFIQFPEKTYTEVLSFLGVPPDGRKKFPKINERKSVNSIFLQQVLRYLIQSFSKIRSKFGLGLKSYGIATHLLMLNSKQTKEVSISEKFKSELKKYCSEDVVKLSELSGRDLTFWIS